MNSVIRKSVQSELINIRVVVLFLAISITYITQQGCSSAELVARQAPSADDTYKKTVVLYLWGVMDYSESIDCDGQGFKRVSTRTNWLYSLCSVVTLGAIVPLELEYRCTSKPLMDGGPIGLNEEILK